ncbi:MAG: Carbohydrate binding domain [Verrucomicrobiota bacterium]|jgi:hypothetical protein
MTILQKALTVIAPAVLLTSTSHAILINGGFESGLTGWTTSGADSAAATAGAHSGSFAFQGFDNSGFATLSQSFATTTGAVYDFSFFSRIPVIHPGNILRYQFNGGPIVTVPTTTTYTQTIGGFTALGSTSVLNFYFETDPGTSAWLIDDVTVTLASSPVPDGGSSIALLGLAMTAAAGFRRKFGI